MSSTDAGDGDYEFVSNSTVTFLPGALASSVRLRALDDAVKEPDETYSFSLPIADSGEVDVIFGAPSSAQVTITDPTCEYNCVPMYSIQTHTNYKYTYTYVVVVGVLTKCLLSDTVHMCSIITSLLHCSAISISFEEANYQLIEGGDVRVTLIANGTYILPFTVNITTTPGSAQGELATSHHTTQHSTTSLIYNAR